MRQRNETPLANAAWLSDGPAPRLSQPQRERDEMVDQSENVIDEIHAEMRGVRDELARLRMLNDAILTERDPTMWSN